MAKAAPRFRRYPTAALSRGSASIRSAAFKRCGGRQCGREGQAAAPGKTGRDTPVFELNEIKTFLEAIKPPSLIDIRDRALFGALAYTWARVSAVVALKVEHYYERKGERWLRLHGKARENLRGSGPLEG